MRFDADVAVITGGGHGIGAATARQLAEEGVAVAVVDVRADLAQEVADAITAGGGRAIAVAADVSDEQAVAAAVERVEADLGPVSLLSANAGVLLPGSVLDLDLQDWDRTIAVNLRGPLLCCRAVMPGMVQRRRGAIVNTASTGGLFGVPGLAAYNASKGAIVNWTRQLAVDYASQGIRINCVCPGWVKTGFNDPLLAGTTEEEIDRMVARVPARRQADPSEIAAAIAFLLSKDASYVSGHALVVDGGLTAAL